MGLPYGLNITSSSMKKVLEENEKQQSGIRTWRQLFGNASLGYEAQSDALRSDYVSAMTEAYKANLARQDAIMGAGYNVGATKEMIGTNRNDLLAAYNTYVRNYNTAQNTVNTNYANEWSGIEKDLVTRAENFAKLYNSAYEYLSKELYGSSYTNVDGEIVDVLTDQGLDWLYMTDETGKPTQELRSWEQLSHMLFESTGSMTDKGREFYDAMFNIPVQNWETKDGISVRSFDKWLSDTNSDLREWWVGTDEYNYTRAGTNKGTAQSIIGLESTDTFFAPYEHNTFEDYGLDVYDFENKLSNWNDAKKKLEDMNIQLENSLTELSKKRANYVSAKNTSSRAGDAFKVELDKAERNYALHLSKIESQKDKIKKEWNKVSARELPDNYEKLMHQLKESLGTEQYNEFIVKNKKQIDELEYLLDEAAFSMSGDDIIEKVMKSYNDFIELIKTNASGRKKSSGF